MEFEQLIRLVKTVSESGLEEFSYEESGLTVRMKGAQKSVSMMPVMAAAPEVQVSGMPMPQASMSQVQMPTETVNKGHVITSPLVGVFYAAPAEDAKPFVQVGDTVKEGSIVAIVEAMKLMNEIESEYAGVITEILVKNGEAVEYGQPLFRVE